MENFYFSQSTLFSSLETIRNPTTTVIRLLPPSASNQSPFALPREN
jgi:hypothetical protein